MQKKFLTILFVTVTFFSHAVICSGDSITIFGNANKPPKTYLENKQPQGILIEIMKYIDQKMPETFEYKFYPWNRAYNLARAGKGGIMGFSKNNERLRMFDYSEVMYYDEVILVVLKGREFTFNTMNDLKGKRVGSLIGASWGEEFEKGKRTIFKVYEDYNTQQRLTHLFHNRIDVAILGPGRTSLERNVKLDPKLFKKIDEFVILPKSLTIDPNYLGFVKSMKMKDFLQKFNHILIEGHKNGDIQKIVNKFE